MSSQSILSTEIDFLDDSDEEKDGKKDFLLACVLVGKYLSEKKKGQHFTPEKDWVEKTHWRAGQTKLDCRIALLSLSTLVSFL